MKNLKISTCTIVRNEEHNIEEFVVSISSFVDEIILVDTGSTDQTITLAEDLAAQFPNKIKFFHYPPGQKDFHYGKAKNFSLTQASGDYLIILDADERITENFFKELRGLLDADLPDVIQITRIDEYVPHLIESHDRIIKKSSNICFSDDESGLLHEQLLHNFPPTKLHSPVLHCQREHHWITSPQRILQQLQLEIDRTPKTKTFIGHLLRGIWGFWFKFYKVYVTQKTYKDGVAGFKFSFLRGFYAFLVQFFTGLKSNTKNSA